MPYNTKEKLKEYRQRPETKKYHAKKQKKYRQKYPRKVYETNKRWTEKNKDKVKEYQERAKQRPNYEKYHREYREKNRELLNMKNREARKQGKLKECDARHCSKRRQLEWNKLWFNPFSEEEKIVWHHIDNKYVVALPKDLHMMYYGKNHRENMQVFIEQIYGELYI